jgi:hypothetical protein
MGAGRFHTMSVSVCLCVCVSRSFATHHGKWLLLYTLGGVFESVAANHVIQHSIGRLPFQRRGRDLNSGSAEGGANFLEKEAMATESEPIVAFWAQPQWGPGAKPRYSDKGVYRTDVENSRQNLRGFKRNGMLENLHLCKTAILGYLTLRNGSVLSNRVC